MMGGNNSEGKRGEEDAAGFWGNRKQIADDGDAHGDVILLFGGDERVGWGWESKGVVGNMVKKKE